MLEFKNLRPGCRKLDPSSGLDSHDYGIAWTWGKHVRRCGITGDGVLQSE